MRFLLLTKLTSQLIIITTINKSSVPISMPDRLILSCWVKGTTKIKINKPSFISMRVRQEIIKAPTIMTVSLNDNKVINLPKKNKITKPSAQRIKCDIFIK